MTHQQLITAATTTSGYLPELYLDALINTEADDNGFSFLGTTTCDACGATIYGEGHTTYNHESRELQEICLDCLLLADLPRHHRRTRKITS